MKDTNSAPVYLDYAASTPMHESVIAAMRPFMDERFGNAGSLHSYGMDAKETLKECRRTCAERIHAHPNDIIFTGSGTESNNIAILGVVRHAEREGRKLSDMHFITTAIEHPSVLDVFKDLEKDGASVTYLPVDEYGLIEPSELRDTLRPETLLVSIMFVNNEMGAMEPIKGFGTTIRKFRKENNTPFPYFHTDASQAALIAPINVDTLQVDLLTLDAQKIYGPKGIGLLYRREGIPLRPVIVGGSQEFALRPSTENIPGIVGFKTALELVCDEHDTEIPRLKELRDYCIEKITTELPQCSINGPVGESIEHRMANNINVSVPGIEGEFLVIALNEKGYACGTRSACIAKGGASYVVEAMGKSDVARNSLRVSLGRFVKKEHIDGFIEALKEVVQNFDRG